MNAKSTSTVSYKEAVTLMKLGKYIFLYGNGPLDLTTSENCNLELIGDVLVDFGYGGYRSSIISLDISSEF